MKIINAKISSDLCELAIEEGLRQLKNKDINKVFLLASTEYKFFNLFQLANEVNFPYINIDTSEVLKRDSWMLIDYESDTIYFNKEV